MCGLTLRQLGADRAARGVVPPPALLQVAGLAGEAAAAVALVRPPLALVDVAVVAEQHPRPLAPPRHPLALVVAAVSVAHPPPAVPPAAAVWRRRGEAAVTCRGSTRPRRSGRRCRSSHRTPPSPRHSSHLRKEFKDWLRPISKSRYRPAYCLTPPRLRRGKVRVPKPWRLSSTQSPSYTRMSGYTIFPENQK